MHGDPSKRQWAISVRYDSTNRCLSMSFDQCLLTTEEDVKSFFAQCETRLRTFELPSDIIVDYAGLRVLAIARAAFTAGSEQWAKHVGGKLYRFASSTTARSTAAFTFAPPAERGLLLNDTYEEAVAEMQKERATKPASVR